MTTRNVILFDLDGTLLDHDLAARRAVQDWAASHHWPRLVAGRPVEELWLGISEAATGAYWSGAVTKVQQRRHRVASFLRSLSIDESVTDDTLDRHFADYRECYLSRIAPFPDALPAMDVLTRSARLAVLTNGDLRAQREKALRAGLLDPLDAFFASSQLGVSKPDPRAFQLALAHLRASTAEATFVGDRLDIDARAATAAGLVGVWIDRMGGSTSVGDVRVISTLSELVAWGTTA